MVSVVSYTQFDRAPPSASLPSCLPSLPASKVTRCRPRSLFQSCSVWVCFEATRQWGEGVEPAGPLRLLSAGLQCSGHLTSSPPFLHRDKWAERSEEGKVPSASAVIT